MKDDMLENGSSRIGYFVAGIGLGALIGILFAPGSGQDTREYIAQKAGAGKNYAQRTARDLRYRAEGLVDRGKQAARRQGEHISEAVEAGRQAFQSEMPEAQSHQ